jgi:hypothetical protein
VLELVEHARFQDVASHNQQEFLGLARTSHVRIVTVTGLSDRQSDRNQPFADLICQLH